MRLIEATDADFAWMLGGNAVARRDLALPPGGVDAADVLAHVREIARRVEAVQGHTDSWMIVDDREVVGLCGYKRVPSADGIVDIGYSIAPSRRGRGYAQAAVAAVLAQSTADPRVAWLIAETTLDNHASQRVLAKTGFARIANDVDPDDGEPIIRWRAGAGTVTAD